MRNRVLLAAGTVAVFVPALLLAQQRPAPRPAPRRAPAPAARPAATHAWSMAGAHLEQTWELSAGIGGMVIGKAPTGKSAAFAPGGMLRVGYNLNPMWNISVGTFGGYGSSATVGTGSTSYLAPFAAVTWTPDINKMTSPFVDVGVGAFYRYTASQTDAAGHVGVGLRHILSDNLAFRGEVGLALFQFKTPGTETSGSGLISIGLSYFVGGRKAVASVAMTPRTATLASLGATQQMSASPMDKNGRPLAGRMVTWSSSDPSVATVSASGLVTAHRNGSATITARSEAGSGTAGVSVAQMAANLAVAPTTATLSALGQTQQLTVTARDANNNTMTGAPVTWTSSDPSVASVDGSGVVTAAGEGTARITAASGSRSSSATVTVAQTTASVAVTPPSSVLSAAGATVQLAAQANDANGQAIANKTFTWTSDAAGVATVNATGVVTAVGDGVAHISAAADGQSGTALVSVVVAKKGAPPVALPTLPSANATLVLKSVNFRVGSAVLPPAAKAELDRIAIAIQGVSHAKWELGGYTSSLGRAATNLRLSRLRANAVRAYLISKGVSAASLTAVGYGSAHPIANNRTVAGRRENMRVEIKRLQ